MTVDDHDPSHYFGAAPGIHLEKDTNGDDANTPTGPFIPSATVNLDQFIVTNTGNVPINGVEVTDDVRGVAVSLPGSDLPAPPDLADPDRTMTCTVTGDRPSADTTPTSARSTARMPTEPSSRTPIRRTTSERFRDPIEKFTNGRDADSPTGPIIRVGNRVTWTYQVTNPGNVLIKDLRVTDSRRVGPRFVGGDADGDTDLDPGEVWRYRATGTAHAGQYRNVGTVNGLDFLERIGSTTATPPITSAVGASTSPGRRRSPSGLGASGPYPEAESPPASGATSACGFAPSSIRCFASCGRTTSRPLVGRARATLLRGGAINLTTPFFAGARRQINALDLVCVFLDVYATDAAGHTRHVRNFIVLRA